MFKIKFENFFWIILICLINKQTFAISGEDISAKVSQWLTKEGINGTPVFSKNIHFKDCKNKLEIKKVFNNYKTLKVNCLDKNGFKLMMRPKIFKKIKIKTNSEPIKLSKVIKEKNKPKKKNEIFRIIKLKKSLEKNDIIKSSDIETIIVKKRHQTSFFTDKRELIGRKLKINLKLGQILHPRHLFESFEINNGDIISIVTNLGNVTVTASGEAQNSGNLGDLIEVKNLKSGKIIKGYIKEEKKIKIFR